MRSIMPLPQPARKPCSAHFSSGPTKKHPGWSPSQLDQTHLGRSHRAKGPKASLTSAIDRMAKLLALPDTYRLGIVPASDTGAVEMIMWSLFGQRGVDMLAWESFGKTWVNDAKNQLQLEDLRVFDAEWGALPALDEVDFDRDVLFTWNGTTSGVKVPNGDFIPDDRAGLTVADATSACFAMPMPWDKIDVATFSWQKSLGGEGAHGVLILSPRAVARLESQPAPRALPKIFQLTKNGKLIEGLFRGDTINTPSMLALADLHSALDWAEGIGGLDALIARSDKSLSYVKSWVAKTAWVAFLAQEEATYSNTSICLQICDEDVMALGQTDKAAFAKQMVSLLADEDVAFDIGAYRTAPAGLRIWAGPTVEPDDIALLLPWLDWAFERTKDNVMTQKGA